MILTLQEVSHIFFFRDGHVWLGLGLLPSGTPSGTEVPVGLYLGAPSAMGIGITTTTVAARGWVDVVAADP